MKTKNTYTYQMLNALAKKRQLVKESPDQLKEIDKEIRKALLIIYGS